MNLKDRIRYILVALLTIAVSYVVMSPLLPVGVSLLLTDSIITGLLLVGILILLKITVKYSNLSALYFYQRTTVYIALAILFVVCWYGSGLLILYYLFPFDEWFLLLQTVPLRIVLGFLIYAVAIQWYVRQFGKEEQPENENCNLDEGNSLKNQVNDAEVNNEEENIDRIAIKNGSKIIVVPVIEIIYLQAEGDYVMVHSIKGKYLKEQTMKSFESILPSNMFVRVHRSSIVNVSFISQIELYDKQNQLLKMQNGVQIRVSLNGYKALKKTLQL